MFKRLTSKHSKTLLNAGTAKIKSSLFFFKLVGADTMTLGLVLLPCPLHGQEHSGPFWWLALKDHKGWKKTIRGGGKSARVADFPAWVPLRFKT